MGAITAQDAGLIKALIDEFNNINCGIDDISTNFWYREETNELVTNISCSPGTKPEQYLLKMREETVKKFYPSENRTKEHFNINSFPFDLTKGKLRPVSEDMYEFATPVDEEVVDNLKKYFAHGVFLNMLIFLCQQSQEKNMGKKMTKMIINEPLDSSSPYLHSASFVTDKTQDGHSYDLLIKSVELLKSITQFLGVEIRDHWNISLDDCQMMLKKANFNEEFVRKMSSLTKMRIAEDFNCLRSQDEKIGNYKDIVTETIFILTGMEIDGYICDNFIHEEEEKIRNEERIVVIPTIKNGDGKTRYLTNEEAKKINEAFEYLGCGDVVTNIEGKTESTKGKKNGGTYGISNKQLANLIQTFIRNSLVTTSGRFEIDPSLTHEQELGCRPLLKRPRVYSVNSAQQNFNKKSHLSPFKENNDRASMGSSRNTVSSDSQIAGEEEILTTSCEEDIAQQNNVHEQLYTTSEETYMENIPPNTVIKNNTNQKSLEKKTNGEIHTTSSLNQDDNKENMSTSAIKKKSFKKNTDKVGNTSKEQKPQASFVKEPQVSNLVQEKQKKKGNVFSRLFSSFF